MTTTDATDATDARRDARRDARDGVGVGVGDGTRRARARRSTTLPPILTRGGRRDLVKENMRAVRERSKANLAARVKEEATRRTVDRAAAKSPPPTTVSPRVEDDLRRYKELGETRKELVEARVRARAPVRRHEGFGETPAYLRRRKAELLAEMNENMERALAEIERRRVERALERQTLEDERARRAREAAKRRQALRARAEIDADKATPIERRRHALELERTRELFARARVRAYECI
jgi:hypothetical protein